MAWAGAGNTVKSPGQKNTLPVPSTGAKPQQAPPKAGLSWWERFLKEYAELHIEENIYNAITGNESPDQVERRAKLHEEDMMRAGADAVTAKASANKLRKDAAAANDLKDPTDFPQWALWGAAGVLVLILVLVIAKR